MNIVAQIRAAIERTGWSETARRSGVSRVTLHRSFGANSRGGVTLGTIERVLPHVGLALTIEGSAQ